MTVLLRGIEKFYEMREERRRIQEERRRIQEEVRAEGRAEGRSQTRRQWEAWANQLIAEGKLPPGVRFPTSEE